MSTKSYADFNLEDFTDEVLEKMTNEGLFPDLPPEDTVGARSVSGRVRERLVKLGVTEETLADEDAWIDLAPDETYTHACDIIEAMAYAWMEERENVKRKMTHLTENIISLAEQAKKVVDIKEY